MERDQVPADILEQCAAQSYIEDLKAPADAEDGFSSGGSRRPPEPMFSRVPLEIGGLRAPVFLTEAGGLDIPAAGEEKTVIVDVVRRRIDRMGDAPGGADCGLIVRRACGGGGDQDVQFHNTPQIVIELIIDHFCGRRNIDKGRKMGYAITARFCIVHLK